MCPLVRPQVLRLTERLLTHATLVGLLARVRPLMHPQRTQMVEKLLACGTAVRLLLVMQSFVFDETLLLREGLLASGTSVRPVQWWPPDDIRVASDRRVAILFYNRKRVRLFAQIQYVCGGGY